jgi:AraC-like DNA-binding protein
MRFYPKIIDVLMRDEKFWYGRLARTFECSLKRNFMYVLHGSGTLTVESGSFLLTAGSAFYFPFRHHIRLSTEKNNILQFYSVHYDYKWIDWDDNSITGAPPAQDSLPIPLVTQMADMEGFPLRLQELYELWQRKDADYEWQARLAFMNILNDVCSMNARRQEGDLARRAIARSMEYIRVHYGQPLERDELAELVSMSPTYYSVMFKRVTCCTPTQYITKVRMDKAKELLVCSDRMVSEVAREVGFQDPLYFARVFSAHTGMSPRDYRKC